jgi:predicted ATPase
LLFFPSEFRTLTVPTESFKAAGKLVEDPKFVYCWQPPPQWKESLEGFLYSLRWEDLNAKEEGRFSQVGHFAPYAEALRRFTGESKALSFEKGELAVRVAGSGIRHGLDELSSGEKQLLLLSGELLRRWRPGSLILIDEPELHLHARWQTKFYEALRYWQKERGGQVILATQSGHLVEIAEAGGLALLGRDAP